jgi:hypothetical protein
MDMVKEEKSATPEWEWRRGVSKELQTTTAVTVEERAKARGYHVVLCKMSSTNQRWPLFSTHSTVL